MTKGTMEGPSVDLGFVMAICWPTFSTVCAMRSKGMSPASAASPPLSTAMQCVMTLTLGQATYYRGYYLLKNPKKRTNKESPDYPSREEYFFILGSSGVLLVFLLLQLVQSVSVALDVPQKSRRFVAEARTWTCKCSARRCRMQAFKEPSKPPYTKDRGLLSRQLGIAGGQPPGLPESSKGFAKLRLRLVPSLNRVWGFGGYSGKSALQSGAVYAEHAA